MKSPAAIYLSAFVLLSFVTSPRQCHADLQAGAAVVDVTPLQFPVLVNGGMYNRSIDKVKTSVNARALALTDGKTTVAIVVVDSCMMPRPLLDQAKELAAKKTGIPADHLLISATHTHTAPSCMGCLGTDADPAYVPFLVEKLAQAIQKAQQKLQPAQIGFGKTNAADMTALRRWIRRPDKVIEDPFGNPTVRANMHSGRVWDDVTGESGPEDPDLSLISIQTRDGKPLAVLANFSMHYYGDRDISADYFGLFCNGLKAKIAPDEEFVGIMSHGCSGDIWRRDYTRPELWNDKQTIDDYAHRLLDIAMQAYSEIEYRHDVDLAMAERRMTLPYRVPNKQLLEWSKRIVEEMGDRLPKTTTEVYAREQLILHERQQTEIVMQGLRIGEIGIATTPNETYAITGLKIKAASPLKHNIVIELANGGDGYIPPPEQHLFGGYNTWAARSAGLEVQAEPKIAQACIELLEEVANQPRSEVVQSQGPLAAAVAKLDPLAWYRLDEFAGPIAKDSSAHQHNGFYEPHVTYYLEGPQSKHFCTNGETNRSAMFVGGRVQGQLAGLGNQYSVSLWLWNGLPDKARDVAGWVFSRGPNNGLAFYGDHLGVNGSAEKPGTLIFQTGNKEDQRVQGTTVIPRWEWQHVVLVRDSENVRVYLNGKLEIETTAPANAPRSLETFFIGGRSDNQSNWEGRVDEVALFSRALNAKEVVSLATGE